ncbi:Golgi apyrase [Rhinocladiella similis]
MVKKADRKYGVVLDAGSSGTRVYIYRWVKNAVARLDTSSLQTLPVIETKEKWTKKVHPGVSTFGEDPESVGPDHLKPLLKHALRHIPKDAVPETPIFLLATAGMRLLPDQQQKDVLRNICSYIRSETDFSLPDCDLHVQVIPGETEGLYGWLAANYLLGGFNAPQDHDHGKGHHTYGFLDMGGASAQIAFAPNATEAEKHANDLTLLRLRTIDGEPQEHKVFVTTWLGFGANEARKRYVEDLEETYSIDGLLEIPDPCLPKGLKLTEEGELLSSSKEADHKRFLLGTGKFEECLRRTFPLLEKDVPCPDEPCLVHGVHVPAIDFEVNHFIGISEYWHTTHEIFEMGHKDKAYDFNTYQNRVRDFCEQDWSKIQEGVADKTWGGDVDEQTVLGVCFKASWLINMLHDGIGIPRVGIENTNTSPHNGTKELLESSKEKGFLDPFQAVNEIKSTEVSWTLGKMVLYASADVPPAHENDLPVGFGSNVPGVPANFQYPSGGALQGIEPSHSGSPSETESQSITDQIHDTLFHSDAPHRLPGFIFFLLIVIIATFYLCGRDRRSRIYNYFFSSPKSSRPPLSFLHKILRRGSKASQYDRDLEDGTSSRLYDPTDFELGNLSASSSDDDLSVTPRPASRSGADKSSLSPQNSRRHLDRLAPAVIDRTGLVVRTESRERLGGDATVTSGRSKSRSGSPTGSK